MIVNVFNGGIIELDSELGQGSTFTFKFELDEEIKSPITEEQNNALPDSLDLERMPTIFDVL